MKRFVNSALRELEEAVFPSSIYCVVCGALIDRSRTYSLCDDCIKKFHWNVGRTCEKCGKALPDTSTGRFCYDCMRQEHSFVRGFSALTYGMYERELMMDLKYAGKGYLARIFGDILFDRMEEEIRRGAFAPGGGESGWPGMVAPGGGEPGWPDMVAPGGGEPGCLDVTSPGTGEPCESDVVAPGVLGRRAKIEVVTAVPVSRGRLRKRGYNQSAIMAGQFVRRWRQMVSEEGFEGFEAPVCRTDVLQRVRETTMLRSLNPAERVLALQGAFQVRPPCRKLIHGKSVLLIDDIMTTGATADACSRALLDGGAAEVYLLALASGGNRRPNEG